MDPYKEFRTAMDRSEHLLKLYEILHDTRKRNVRFDWANKLKELMGWPAREEIVRVDGDNSIVILREESGINRDHFTHDILSELLRAALTFTVSSLDRYLHDVIVSKCWSLLDQTESNVPRALRELPIPAYVTVKSLRRLRTAMSEGRQGRAGTIVKASIQEVLHKRTFQSPKEIEDAAQILGIEKIWIKVADKIAGNQTPQDIKRKLHKIVHRRNQIVHEADLYRKQRGELSTREISYKMTRSSISWIKDFIFAFNEVVSEVV